MNKKFIMTALALSLGSAAFAQSSVTLYGVIDTAVQRQTNATPTGGSLSAVTSGAISGSRYGFRGQEDLGGGMKALFTLEAGFNPNDGSRGQGGLAFGRQAFVGLAGDFGQVTLGRQYTPLFEHYGNFDPLWGISNVNESGFYLAYGTFRQNNAVRYAKNIAGVNFAAMHGFGNVANSASAGQLNGLQATYAVGSLNLGAAYQKFDVNTTSSTNLGSTKNAMIAANYGFGPARVYFNYMDTKLASGSKSDVATLGVSYEVAPLVNLVGAYYNDKTKSATNVKGSRNTTALGLTYSLSKRTMVYGYYDRSKENAGYAVTAIPAGSDIFGAASTLNTRSNYMVGIRHAF
ncbi:porin [Curvibacter sp. HBC61]|uniref:Porin n=1 Tax=Curvibacter cyanobacteriorum TaxID=3026422 RepID=A0ABT5N3Z4_9BURK|nr:porin [Curvibacter sp. HBC61]MDD0841034.1 porin [Curvibacter sp. HBC61]